tara:strand:- start:1059 stop:1181 length:123 start_codon:yes stop_codon:yes gene_type:complete
MYTNWDIVLDILFLFGQCMVILSVALGVLLLIEYFLKEKQ